MRLEGIIIIMVGWEGVDIMGVTMGGIMVVMMEEGMAGMMEVGTAEMMEAGLEGMMAVGISGATAVVMVEEGIDKVRRWRDGSSLENRDDLSLKGLSRLLEVE